MLLLALRNAQTAKTALIALIQVAIPKQAGTFTASWIFVEQNNPIEGPRWPPYI